MIVTVKCPHCGKEFSKEFEDSKLKKLHTELVQDVFPELSANENIENKIELSAEEFADIK